MSIKRDECTRAPDLSDESSAPRVGTFQLLRELNGVLPGIYFGPLEDIKLLVSELDLDDAAPAVTGRCDICPAWSVGIVLDGAMQQRCNVFVATHAGYRDGCPLFTFEKVTETYGSRLWWVIPFWIARRFGFPQAGYGFVTYDDAGRLVEYHLRPQT